MGKIFDLEGKLLLEYEGELKGRVFEGVNLWRADFNGKDLSDVTFFGCFLLGASFCYGANLSGVTFDCCFMHNTAFRATVFSHITFSHCDCISTVFSGIDFANVVIWDSILAHADFIACENHPYFPLACPSEGAFTGWKKVFDEKHQIYCLVELEIPADARRCSATSRKCRCDKAKVVSIKGMEGEQPDEFTEVENFNCKIPLLYKVGEMVYPDSYDEDRWHECTHGIHFFINKQDAIDY